ncbi:MULTISPECIES: hypothetical protein [unclassified Tolypothrix]|uniref:hypothetical protein n=1 Tax=unclassified Tolypothrix TaxID=2649714 RepID=UPI0012D7A28E|nr:MULTISPECIES: hypothetical protein [unclassified Tolypothrix]MBE9086937.1 hypothetical protein [Tolypothrix sp. LEGE 11397]UYD29662.1 hypothetical protein HGR01_17555 [Tolypothrix sp. PCC 7712]UYD34422.1 hypothetical protein HG267_00725 [Tolypothrix sp. PCC 7601]
MKASVVPNVIEITVIFCHFSTPLANCCKFSIAKSAFAIQPSQQTLPYQMWLSGVISNAWLHDAIASWYRCN